MKRLKGGCVYDRLSDLPENLIHHIISFLSSEEAARFSTLSKRLSFAHLSFPWPDFRFRYSCNLDLFLDCIRRSLGRRRTLETSFERLTFVMYLLFDDALVSKFNSITEVFEDLVNFVLDKKIAELKLYCIGEYQVFRYLEIVSVKSSINRLPSAIFSVKTIKILKLSGVLLGSKDLILRCPLIEAFHLAFCPTLESIQVSSCAKLLKKISIYCCQELERIHFDKEANLDRKSLKVLKLRDVAITDEWFQNNMSKYESLETLKLVHCKNLKSICVRNENLKYLELRCFNLDDVDVMVSGLESLQMYGRISRRDWPHCKINIGGCKWLKNLIISRISVTDKWIEDNLSALTYLENLELQHCELILNNPVKVSLDNLKSLRINCYSTLYFLEIDSPKLVSFQYNGPLVLPPPIVLVSSKLKDAEIFLHFRFLDDEPRGFYRDLRDFLTCFARCDTVLLSPIYHSTREYFIFPEDVRKTSIPPLYDVKHLKIEVTTKRIVELVDSLLWVSPHPETISFVRCIPTAQTKFIIKLFYREFANSEVKEEEDNNVTTCCLLSPVRCWRHDLTEVALVDFEDGVRISLQSYFMENARARITII